MNKGLNRYQVRLARMLLSYLRAYHPGAWNGLKHELWLFTR